MCAVPRLAAALFFHPVANYYWDLAGSLAAGHGFALGGEPSTFMEPLYPAFLAALRRLTGDHVLAVELLQGGFGALGGVFLFLCAERLAGRRAAFAATALYAFYPYYARQSVAWIEVTFVTTLLIAALRQFSRIENIKGAALCGLCLGLLLLTRSTFLVTLIALAGWLAISRQTGRSLILVAVALAVALPWWLRNRGIDGSFLPPRAGENLFVSTSEFSRAASPRYDVDLLIPHAYESIADEVARRAPDDRSSGKVADAVFLERVAAYAVAHPGDVVWLKIRNALYLFDPRLLPAYEKSPDARAVVNGASVTYEGLHSRPWLYSAAHAIAQAGLIGFGAAGVWMRRRQLSDDAGLLIAAASFALVYTIFFPTTRLMAPAMVVLMFYAGVALEGLLRATSAAEQLQR